jgi:hypothetical protein
MPSLAAQSKRRFYTEEEVPHIWYEQTGSYEAYNFSTLWT